MAGYIRRILERFRALLHLDDPPRRIALALAVGVFISCTPFYGLQTVLSILVATVFRLNKAATVTGTWLNLPWFTPFVYGAALAIGGRIIPDPSGFQASIDDLKALLDSFRSYSPISVTAALSLARRVSVALLVGTTIVGILAAAATYVVAFKVISHRRGRTGSAEGAGPRRRAA